MVAQTAIKKGIFRAVAVALLALCAGFTFPEGHYSVDKTFVKTPSPQTEICTLLCDDVEDSNDVSTGIHFFQSAIPAAFSFSLEGHSLSSSIETIPTLVYGRIFLRHKQLLI